MDKRSHVGVGGSNRNPDFLRDFFCAERICAVFSCSCLSDCRGEVVARPCVFFGLLGRDTGFCQTKTPVPNPFFGRLQILRARQKGDSKREKPDPERRFSQIFADFR